PPSSSFVIPRTAPTAIYTLSLHDALPICTHEYIATGSHENKFGIALSDAVTVYEHAAQMRSIDIVGVQMHIGSQITETKPFIDADRKSTRLNSSHVATSYAVFCLKKKTDI